MGTINRFEDLDCWKSARLLAGKVYKFSQAGEISRDFDTRSQFRRAALSIMNNIAEGFGRFSDQEKKRFLKIAHGSSNELASMLYLIEDIDYLPDPEIQELREQNRITKAQILGLIKYLKQ